MICPQCGASYGDTAEFCANDGAVLVRQPVANQNAFTPLDQAKSYVAETAVTDRPALSPAPKHQGRWLALVLAIALVAVVAVGGVLVAKSRSSRPSGPTGVTVTGAAPVYTEDWTYGLSQAWQQHFGDEAQGTAVVNGVVAMAPDVWMVSHGSGLIDGIDPATGQTLWTKDLGDESLTNCTTALSGGKWACMTRGGAPDYRSSVCLVDEKTGDQSCVDTADLALPATDSVLVTTLWFADGALIVADEVAGEESAHWEVARLSVPSLTVDWTQTYDDACDGGWLEPAPNQRDASGVAGNVLWFSSTQPPDFGPADFGPPPLAIDIRNGQKLFSPCVGIYPLTDDTFMAAPDIPAGSLTLPGGGAITIVNSGGAIAYASGQLPKVPVYYVPSPAPAGQPGYAEGTLGVNGSAWPVTLPIQQGITTLGAQSLAGAAADNTLVVAGGQGQVVAVDCTTGQTIWSATVAVSHYGDYGASGDLSVSIVGNMVVVAGTASDPTTLLSLATGQEIGTVDAQNILSPRRVVVSPDNTMVALVDGSQGTVSRLVPAAESRMQPPADMPACPSDASPVAWTKYADGSVLVCSGDGTYQVVSSQDWKASQIDWRDDGYTITFSNWNVIDAQLGGALVAITNGSRLGAVVASESWTISSGTAVFSAQPTDLPGCAADGAPISLSTWAGGWLMVCGTSAASPTSIVYRDGNVRGQTSSVGSAQGGYCGNADAGTVCAYRSPAVVLIGGAQHSVGSNYFVGAGGGGVGQGIGPFGLSAPGATAQAQAEYLAGILNSASALSVMFETSRTDVQACIDLTTATARLQDAAQNRQALMIDLTSAPTDQIPDGAQLAGQLQTALQASYDLAAAYLDWGQSRQTSGCRVKRPQGVTDASKLASDTMDAFVAAWNGQIAPTYSVPTFSTDQF